MALAMESSAPGGKICCGLEGSATAAALATAAPRSRSRREGWSLRPSDEDEDGFTIDSCAFPAFHLCTPDGAWRSLGMRRCTRRISRRGLA